MVKANFMSKWIKQIRKYELAAKIPDLNNEIVVVHIAFFV